MEFAKLVLFLFISIVLPPCLSMPIPIISAIVRLVMRSIHLQATAHLTWQWGCPFAGRRPQPSSTSSYAPCLQQALTLCSVELCNPACKSPLEGSNEQVVCVFCLSNIEEGEEIRELRCRHLFHKSCFDRWIEHGRAACPLCRNSLILQETKAKVPDMDDEELDNSAVSFWWLLYLSGWSLWSVLLDTMAASQCEKVAELWNEMDSFFC
ncbi:E3 ubiquitin-protein ligase RNF126-like [Phoenix dactylifera]|uniref:E3 ubiquitin-protein ligase RNF126-like n=1 Tax=Phoenix dactylifera TaxID=42345 RepID=A0A8B7CS75_PHODC|nr:E3 ubiquitin-protein ligase RNF126-like [Phoenix dactylifera]